MLGEHGIERDDARGREAFERWMEKRRAEESGGEEWKAIRRGWCLGPAEFKAMLLERMEGKLGEHHSGEIKRESAAVKAERIIGEELRRLGWNKDELSRRRKSDPGKLAIASRLRRETTLTMGQVAAQLQMGSWKSLKAKLYVWRKANERENGI